MKLTNFEDWFAIRANHCDDDHWPGRLIFDLDKGIYLSTVRFTGTADSHGGPTLDGKTITGWLDYQQPTTLINPWIQTFGGLTMGVNAPAMRASCRFVVNAVLKNIFLEDINEQIFNGLIVDHPAVHAWVNPDLIDHDWSDANEVGLRSLSVSVAPPKQRTFQLRNGIEAVVTSGARTARREAMELGDYTTLKLNFSEPVSYDTITRFAWRISALFEFMIGARTEAPVYELPTTHKRVWNNEPRQVVAEFWYRPARMKRINEAGPRVSHPFIDEDHSSVSLESLLGHISGGSDELIYLANTIQSVEDQEMPIPQAFGELIGCLEDFDTRQFGDGSDQRLTQDIRNLATLVRQHGSDTDRLTFDRLRKGVGNRYSLLQRLERLHRFWCEDSFRGNPDLRKIRHLRNFLPHGQGLQLSVEKLQEMSIYLNFLSALGRYHVLRALGYGSQNIATAFLKLPHRYGRFVPKHMFNSQA